MRRHVASGAGWGLCVVLAQHPGMGVEIHVIVQVAVGDAVLRFLVDFLLRMVGTEVTLATVLRLPGASRRKVVSRVARRAGTKRPVEIDPPDAGVGPRGGAEHRLVAIVAQDFSDGVEVRRLAFFIGLQIVDGDFAAVGGHQPDLAAVALFATGVHAGHTVDHVDLHAGRGRMGIERLSRTFNGFRQKVVERGQNVAAFGMMAVSELLGFLRMTTPAVHRCDHRGDGVAVMMKRIGVLLISLMALDTANALDRVGRAFPVVNDARREWLVTSDARLRRRRNRHVMRRKPCFFTLAGDFHPLNKNERYQEHQSQKTDQQLFGFETHRLPPKISKLN